MLHRSAGWLARREVAPTALRAVMGYYADSGVFDYRSLRLKGRVDDTVEGMLRDAFAEIEAAIAEAFGYGYVSFEYDTKLVLPAKLTLGYRYRHGDDDDHAEAVTRLVVEALVDGDMRDALNDDEFDDFEVDFETDAEDRRRVAEIAQEVLQARVEDGLSRFPDELRDAYDAAVDRSEAHQDEDARFRELMAAAGDGDPDALAAIRAEYRDATFEEPPELFTPAELELPYVKTQYDRVGVIYDAMIDMYRAAGLPVAETFERSIVLAIIGAQVWLDDVDDYAADMREGQLTPVTAEYLLAEDETAAREAVIEVSERYLDRARREATAADSTLTGIATEYIYHSATPETLPG